MRLRPLADMMRTTASLIVHVTNSIRPPTKPIASRRGSSSASLKSIGKSQTLVSAIIPDLSHVFERLKYNIPFLIAARPI
jgi:hypothetical protein